MKYNYELDKNNYIQWIIHTDSEKDTLELPLEIAGSDYLTCYKLVDNEVIFDEEKYNTLISMENIKQEVEVLKKQLSDTDYKIIKCSEYQLAGLEIPYDVAKLHKDRQELRDKINELEN